MSSSADNDVIVHNLESLTQLQKLSPGCLFSVVAHQMWPTFFLYDKPYVNLSAQPSSIANLSVGELCIVIAQIELHNPAAEHQLAFDVPWTCVLSAGGKLGWI